MHRNRMLSDLHTSSYTRKYVANTLIEMCSRVTGLYFYVGQIFVKVFVSNTVCSLKTIRRDGKCKGKDVSAHVMKAY